jgi:hypothetical protein
MSERGRLLLVGSLLAAGAAGLAAIAIWIGGAHPDVCNGNAEPPGPSGWVWTGFILFAAGVTLGGLLGAMWTDTSLRVQRVIVGIAFGEGVVALALAFWLEHEYSNVSGCGV